MQFKILSLAFVSIIFWNCSMAVVNVNEKLLTTLDKLIENIQYIDNQKESRIKAIKTLLQTEGKKNYDFKQTLLKKILEEYKVYQYDSALYYAHQLIENAHKTGNNTIINSARLDYAFILLSAGLFKETLDTLKIIQKQHLTDSLKSEYHFIYARAYFDLADYIGDRYYFANYNVLGNLHLDSAIAICDTNTIKYLSFKGLKSLRKGEIKNARQIYEKLLTRALDKHQFAIEASCLSYIYQNDNEPVLSEEMLIRAVIADIEASTKETVAIRKLAEILLKRNDIDRAFRYIKVALDDANFFGARHRRVQVADILPQIEERQLEIVNNQRHKFLIYSFIITFLLLVIVVFAIIIFNQYRKMIKVKNNLDMANNELTRYNQKLSEANKIKEAYIARFFDDISTYIDRLEKLKANISRKVTTNQFNEIKEFLSEMDIKSEREQFFKKFDIIFLNIFPQFTTIVNSMITDESLKIKGNSLPPEIRIYALMRLGIQDNERIARFLGYSLNTIYAYKTKIKNKINTSIEAFEQKLMLVEAL